MTMQPGTRLGHYILEEKLGEGGMGVVWKAADTRLGRTVAIKLLAEGLTADPQRLAWFDREARALAALNHPGIVTVYSVEESGGARFFTMEYVRGVPLSRHVPESGLPLAAFFELAVPIADAIRAAHSRGITHRDLKPANILVGPGGEVKVLDFGVAQFLRAASPHPSRSGTPGGGQTRAGSSPVGRAADGVAAQAQLPEPVAGDGGALALPDDLTRTAGRDAGVVGTPSFMSPEQVRGLPVDQRSDLFSAGVLLYVMLTGRLPFTADSVGELLTSIARDTPLPVDVLRPELPDFVARIVERCLAKGADERFPSAEALHAALVAARDRCASAPAAIRSVAVLPFDDLSPERDQGYFCEGMAEEILLALTRIPGLRVSSRSAAFLARATMPEGRDIGQRLGVDALLEGSVRKVGSRVRIGVELTEVASGFHLWTERYDREMQDILAIQDEIAARVADALRGTVTPRGAAAPRQAAAVQLQAYDSYLRGRKFFYQYSRKGMEFARAMFERALALDPRYARAWAGIANCHAYLYLYGGRREEDLEAAERASLSAMALAPESGEAHAARGMALSLRRQHEAAEAEFQAAIRVNPTLFDAYFSYARLCFTTGRPSDAARLYERAMEISPEDYQSPLLVAQIHDDLGRHGDAEAARRRGVALADDHLHLHPDDVRALYMGANGLVALGRREQGLAWARRALALEPSDAMVLYNVACIYSMSSLVDEALDCLEGALRHGLQQPEYVRHDSNLDAVRGTARYARLIEGMGK